MINNQLTATIEEIGQRFPAVWSIEHIFLLDADHRELAPRRTKRVALASELLFSRQQIPPRDQPLSFRYDFRLSVCYFHFALLQFRLFDVFGLLQNFSSLQTPSTRHLNPRRSNQTHLCDTSGTHRISRLILFAADIFQTLATRDPCGPMSARLMSTHLLAG